jgi:hypothetical protein
MESLGGHSNEGAGGPTAIDYSHPLRQDLPRSVTPISGTDRTEVTRTMASVTTRYGLLHYANLIRRTGPSCFLFQPT